MSKYLIGIDPDIEYNGYCVYNTEEEVIEDYGTKDFWGLIDIINQYKNNLKVIIEGGWLIPKKNWHSSKNQNVAERIAYNVGQNHCIGQLLHTYCIKHNIPCEVTVPRGKISRKEFQMITQITKRVNQDVIDAVMLVYKIKG